MNKLTTFIFATALGCAAGAITALALTYRNDKETQANADCVEKAPALSAKKECPCSNIASTIKTKCAEFIKNAQDDEPMSEEELKAKIEEARQKIMASKAEAEAREKKENE